MNYAAIWNEILPENADPHVSYGNHWGASEGIKLFFR